MDLAQVGKALIANGAGTPADLVCVTNEAGFDLKYYFLDLITGEETSMSGMYPADQTRCSHIGDTSETVRKGDILLLKVHAVAGTTFVADTSMVYTPGASALNYICHGATLNFGCRLWDGNKDMPIDVVYAVNEALKEMEPLV